MGTPVRGPNRRARNSIGRSLLARTAPEQTLDDSRAALEPNRRSRRNSLGQLHGLHPVAVLAFVLQGASPSLAHSLWRIRSYQPRQRSKGTIDEIGFCRRRHLQLQQIAMTSMGRTGREQAERLVIWCTYRA
jgi:hypothetical protein